LGDAGAPGWPQTLADASNWQARASPTRPSLTPSCASHAAIAEAFAACIWALVSVKPATSLFTHAGQTVATCRRVWKLAGAPVRKPSKSLAWRSASARPCRPPVEQPFQ
jgi:hypothetical protein